MAILAAWQFATADGAQHALAALRGLPADEIARIHDAAVVTWPDDRTAPRTRPLTELTGPGELGAAFWGLLFGILFLMPLLGSAIGPPGGQLALAGIDDTFLRRIRDNVRRGTSALFVLSADAVLDRVRAAFPDSGAALISTNLSADQEENLRHAFADGRFLSV